MKFLDSYSMPNVGVGGDTDIQVSSSSEDGEVRLAINLTLCEARKLRKLLKATIKYVEAKRE